MNILYSWNPLPKLNRADTAKRTKTQQQRNWVYALTGRLNLDRNFKPYNWTNSSGKTDTVESLPRRYQITQKIKFVHSVSVSVFSPKYFAVPPCENEFFFCDKI